LKLSQILAASVLLLLLVSATPVQQVRAQGAYSEKLSVYVSGSNALWYMTFAGINGSSKLSSFESSPGLAWYNISAVQTSGWVSDFQIFGSQGYNLLPVPVTSSQGIYLNLGSDTYQDAAAAAGALDSFLLTAFVSVSNGTGSYDFFSPFAFNTLVPATMLTLLPTGEGGFVSAIGASSFDGTASPMVILEGLQSGSGFSHTLVVGSITTKALSSGAPAILGYFGSKPSFLRASNHSSSSVIQIRALDGIISSNDTAVVANDPATFTGSYTLTLAPGRKVSALNATVLQQPAQLMAYRTVDAGVLHTGQNIAITVSMSDLSTTAIAGIHFSDNWWNTAPFQGLFTPVTNTTFPSTLTNAAPVTPVYVLKYVGTATEKITIPASVISYSFTIGRSTFHGTATLNAIPLSLGADDPVVLSYVTPVGTLGKPVGQVQNFTVVAKNVGTLSAASVTIAGQSVPGLSVNGSASVTVSQSATGLLGTNVTKYYTVNYVNPNNPGVTLSSSTNTIVDVFSHSSMHIGSPFLLVTDSYRPLGSTAVNLTLAFFATNGGTANVTSYSATGLLPSGLACGTVSSTALTCVSGRIYLRYASIGAGQTETSYMVFNETALVNYIVPPMSFSGATAGLNFTGLSNPVGIPTGLVVGKHFSPSQMFGGMTSTVTVEVTDAGPFPVRNATVTAGADSFDALISSAATAKSLAEVVPGGNATFSYPVRATTYGTLLPANATVSFYFAGSSYTVQGTGPAVSIYKPLSVSITTSPSSPTEGKSFSMRVTISNPTGVTVSNVEFTLPLPKGFGLSQLEGASVVGGVFTMSSPTLGAYGTLNATAQGVAGSGITVPFDKASLTFSYGGTTVKGSLPAEGIAIAENITTRYLIPTALVLLALLAIAFYVRRKTYPSVPVSQK
jgi:hypothetical protein